MFFYLYLAHKLKTAPVDYFSFFLGGGRGKIIKNFPPTKLFLCIYLPESIHCWSVPYDTRDEWKEILASIIVSENWPPARYTFFFLSLRVIYDISIYLLAFIHGKLKQNDLESGLGVKSTLSHVLWRIMYKSSVKPYIKLVSHIP